MSQIHAERDQTNVVLPLAVTDGGGVPGLDAVVALRDGPSSTSYLDWADMTFKAAAWTTREAVMTDLGAGFYTRLLDLSAITNLPGATRHLIAEYRVSGAIEGVAEDHILLANAVFDVAIPGDAMTLTPTERGAIVDAVWDEPIAGHLTAGTTGETLNTVGGVSNITIVKAGFALNTVTDILEGNLWLEEAGQIVTVVTSASVEFYSSSGILLFPALTDGSPDVQGVFRVTQASPVGLVPENHVYARLQIVTPTETITSLQSFQLLYPKTAIIEQSLIFGN